ALLALPLAFGFAAAGALLFPLLFAAALLLVGLLFHATEKFYLLEAAPVLALLVGAGLDRMTAAIRAVGSRPARAALVALCGAAAGPRPRPGSAQRRAALTLSRAAGLRARSADAGAEAASLSESSERKHPGEEAIVERAQPGPGEELLQRGQHQEGTVGDGVR